MEVNSPTVSFNPNIEMQQSAKAQQQKVDLSLADDKVELKAKSKTKKGAKIGALAGLGYAALNCIAGGKILKELMEMSIKSGGNKAKTVAGLALGLVIGAAADCGIGAGIGALAGKIADCFSHKSDK